MSAGLDRGASAGLDMLHALVLEGGRCWGAVAADFQRQDAAAIFGPDRPHLHFLTRPRGGSKTTDVAGVALSWLAAEAPERARAYVLASNADQAALTIDAAAGFVARTAALGRYITVENERLVAPNGASVRVLPASDSGSWGLLNARLLICDEFAQWPETRGAKRVWTAIRSTVQKVPGCRLVILTSAGEPSHWSYGEVYKRALEDPENWRVHEVAGPVPWQDPADIEALRRELMPSEFDRLVLNRWSESEERVVSPEDYEAAAVPARRWGSAPAGTKGGGWRAHGPRDGVRYLVTADLGLVADATAIAVSHVEAAPEGTARRLVVDHIERWQGSKRHRVQLRDVEARLADLSAEYGAAPIRLDPDQAQGTIEALNRRGGLHAEAFAFTVNSVGQVATALVRAFHDRTIEVPASPELCAELLAVRLRDAGHGVARLDHDRGAHDDQAVVIGMAAHLLLASTWSSAAAFMAMMRRDLRRRSSAAPESDGARAMPRPAGLLASRASGPQQRPVPCGHFWRKVGGRWVCSPGPDGRGGCGAVQDQGA